MSPSKAVQLAAVQQDGYAIQHIKNPSEEVQIAAVQQNGEAIRVIQYFHQPPSEAVQLAAVQQNVKVFGYIKNPTKTVINFVEEKTLKKGIKIKYKGKMVNFSDAFVDHMKGTEFESLSPKDLLLLIKSYKEESMTKFIKFMKKHYIEGKLLKEEDAEEISNLFKVNSVQNS